MSRTWTVPGKSQEDVKKALVSQLSATEIPSFASVDWDGYNMKVELAKAGKSKFTMTLETSGGSTVIRETDRNVAFVHKPFVSRVEKFVDELMEKVMKS